MSIAGTTKNVIRWPVALATVGIAVAALSGCDSTSEPVGDNPRQVTVVGSGQVQGVPDTLTAEVGIEFVAPDATTAMNQTSERLQAVITAVTEAGVAAEDVSTTRLSLQPQYDAFDAAGAGPITGYLAQNFVAVTIRRLDSASRVLAVIADTGGDATRISSVSYSIEDDSQLVRDARARAFDDAESRAEQYAELSGLTLGKVLSISEASGAAPIGEPRQYRSAVADVPVEPGQQTVSFSVTAAFELR